MVEVGVEAQALGLLVVLGLQMLQVAKQLSQRLPPTLCCYHVQLSQLHQIFMPSFLYWSMAPSTLGGGGKTLEMAASVRTTRATHVSGQNVKKTTAYL